VGLFGHPPAWLVVGVTVSSPRSGLTYRRLTVSLSVNSVVGPGPWWWCRRLSVADRPAVTGRSTVPHEGGGAIPNQS
jgi:hypothetical protein